jgi:hypothetical protein
MSEYPPLRLELTIFERGPGLSDIDLIWYGGHAIHVFVDGRETEVLNVGSFARESATLDEVAEAMVEWAKENVLPEEVKS